MDIPEKVLNINDYAEDISLFTLYERYNQDYQNEDDMNNELTELKDFLMKYTNRSIPNFDTHNFEESMQCIRIFLNIRNPFNLPPRIYELIDHALSHRILHSNVTDSKSLSCVNNSKFANSNQIFLWKGDISLLKIDAIVNAANSQMLGCFHPLHGCIDNVIHTFAGPRLRDDCATFMNKQRFEEPTGFAKITRAYSLPSKYVVHTVGPIYESRKDEICRKELVNSYQSCLEVASQIPEIRSIAFCCISTGVFRFPQKLAAQLAAQTVDQWLSNHPGRMDQVVFNVFTEKDLAIYTDILYEK